MIAAVTVIDYDTAGNPVAIAESGFSAAGAVDRATTLTYDDLGRVTAVDGPRTDVVDAALFDHYPNDPGYGPDRGRLMRVVDAAGRIVSRTTAGLTTEADYDPAVFCHRRQAAGVVAGVGVTGGYAGSTSPASSQSIAGSGVYPRPRVLPLDKKSPAP